MSGYDQKVSLGEYSLGVSKDVEENPLWWSSATVSGNDLATFLGYPTDYVNPATALQTTAALICLDVLAQDISKARFMLKKEIKDGSDEISYKKHPMAKMLKLEPNERHTWIEFIQMMVYHLVMTSNSYTLIKRDKFGEILSLIPLVPGRVQDNINQKTGEVFYQVGAGNLQEAALIGAWEVNVPERDMIHIRQRIIDGFWGTSTLRVGGPALTGLREITGFGSRMFKSDGTKGFFVRNKENPLNDELFRRMQQQVRKAMKKGNDNSDPVVLEDGIEFKQVTQTAAESEFNDSLNAAIEAVCKLWRMPPHKAMHLQAVKYENLATMEAMYARDTLEPLCRLIEERFKKQLLTKTERLSTFFWFNRDDMIISDQKQEVEETVRMSQAGLITHDEARSMRGWNPLPDGAGNVRTVAANTKWVTPDGETWATGAKVTADDPEAPEPVAPTGDEPSADDEAKEARGRFRVVA